MMGSDMDSLAKRQLAQMARYHVWATDRLLSAVDALPDEAYRRDCGLFFGTVHGTLNHLLLTDSEIWYPRFIENRSPAIALDAELETDRAALRARLAAATRRWPDYIATLDDDELAGDLSYIMTTGQPRVLPLSTTLLHVFNHATHHRGQITTALTMMGVEYPALDLAVLLVTEQA
jgi:uncharacterized damage-inducible protein DinB